MLLKVELDFEEWQRVLQLLSQAQWFVANPLIMKIGEQLRVSSPRMPGDGEAPQAFDGAAPAGKVQ